MLRGGIDVPLLQGVGDVLPQAPAQGEGAQGRVRTLPQPSAAGHQSGEQQAEATLSMPVFQVPQLGNHHSPTIFITSGTRFSDSLNTQYFAMQFSQQTLFMFLSLHHLSFFLKAVGFIFIISSSHSLLMFLQSPDDRHLICGFLQLIF